MSDLIEIYKILTILIVPLAVLWTQENMDALKQGSLNSSFSYYLAAVLIACIPFMQIVYISVVIKDIWVGGTKRWK